MELGIYRLKVENEIIGFLRVEQNQYFYSKNGHHWSGKKLEFEYYERFTGFKDRNDKRIFEGDIVSSTIYTEDEYIIYYDQPLKKFLLVSYENRTTFNCSLNEFFKEKHVVTRVGFLLR